MPAYFSANAWYVGSSLRQGAHQLAHRLITIGPRRLGQVDGLAAVERGQGRVREPVGRLLLHVLARSSR